MEVKHVARVGLPSRRLAQEQRKLPIDDGMLGQVVKNEQRVLSAVPEILRDTAGGVGRDPLGARCSIGGPDDKHRSVSRAMCANRINDPCHGGRFLTDSGIDADHV